MSGSPLRVGKAGGPLASDPLVGAVSYGDIFTTNGLGLATPIDLMSSIETKYTVDPALAVGPTEERGARRSSRRPGLSCPRPGRFP